MENPSTSICAEPLANLKFEDWDDAALIEAYDLAMGTVKKKEVTRTIFEKPYASSKGGKRSQKRKWKVGDNCRAVFSDDNQSYEAEILELNEKNETCIVLFIGYDNKEEVSLKMLSSSKGKIARADQVKAAHSLKWNIGDLCLAKFSEDGKLYQAEVINVFADEEYCCVKFLSYENKEDVDMCDMYLLKEESEHFLSSDVLHPADNYDPAMMDNSSMSESSMSSEKSAPCGASCHSMDNASRSHRPHSVPNNVAGLCHLNLCPPPQPPLPPHSMNGPMTLPASLETHEDELGPVLLAWYMAGYQTGYYQGRMSRLSESSLHLPCSKPH